MDTGVVSAGGGVVERAGIFFSMYCTQYTRVIPLGIYLNQIETQPGRKKDEKER